MSMPGDDGDRDPNINWESLEAEFEGAEERAEAAEANYLEQTSLDIKGILHQVLPPEVMASFEPKKLEPAAIDDLPLGLDGQPIITNPEQARLVAAERPEIAAITEKISRLWTAADRQQLDLDFERAEAANDGEWLAELGIRKLELDERIANLEFFAALVTLHPISLDYKNKVIGAKAIDNTTYASTPINTAENQVALIDMLDKTYVRLSRQVRDYSPRTLDAMRQDATGDARYMEYVKHVSDLTDERAGDIYRLRRIFNDIMNGMATIFTDPEASEPEAPWSATHEISADRLALYEIIKNLPGFDPVRLTLEERFREFPQSGWLITTRVTPGVEGVIDIYHVTDGAFQLSSYQMTSDIHRAMGLRVGGAPNGRTDIQYRSYQPYNGNRGYSDWDDNYDDKTELREGKWLFAHTKPVRALDFSLVQQESEHKGIPGRHFGGLITSINSDDIDRAVEKYGTPNVRTARITEDADTARDIVRRLCMAMGMNEDEINVTLGKLEKIDTFGGLQTELVPVPEKYDPRKDIEILNEYPDGSQFFRRGNEYWVREADGTEWCQQSSSGLMYSGPDDLIGFYPE